MRLVRSFERRMWLLGAACLLLGFLPIVLTPLQADDAYLMLRHNADGGTLVGVVGEAIDGTVAQGRTNFGTAVASGVHSYVLWQGAVATGTTPQRLEVVLGLLWALAATYAAARFAARAWPASPSIGNGGVAFFFVAACVSATAQIHSRWSQDPMVSYPMYGLGTAAVGFAYLEVCLHAVRRGLADKLSAILMVVVGVLAIFWYEMLWPLFLLSTVLAAILFVRWRREGRSNGMFTAIRFWLFAVGLPLLSLVLVRVLIRPEGQYEGTELVISADGAKSGLLGVLSTIPAAAWPFSGRGAP